VALEGYQITLLTICSTYKGSKIEWDNDECAAPLERPVLARKENPPSKKKDTPLMNRFQLLNMDGTDDGSEEDGHDTSGITLPTAMTSSTLGVVA
jgi:hypothetical protein